MNLAHRSEIYTKVNHFRKNNTIMPHARIVPWADPKELDDLKIWFYSENEREKAVAKVKSYQSRGSQFLPHVIDSTSQLTSAVLLDETNNQVGMNAIRMAYTMALIRFVNGILDPNQRAQYAIPLHRLAQNVGLSSWFVELRHWGTHERELPSIEMLRITTKEALTWLWDHYWNDNTLEDLSSEEENEENIEEETINESASELKKLQLLWPGLHYDFMHNKSVWQNDNNSLISSSNFVVIEKDNNHKISKQKLKSPEEKINNYVEEWITLWRTYPDREQFISQVMDKYNSVLLHILILKLTDFEIHYFRWLLKEYKIQLTINEKSSNVSNDSLLSKHFSQWSELERQLVKRVINYVNPKLITSRWNQWSDLFMNDSSYLSIVILKTILKKTNDNISGSRSSSNNSSNNDWRKKKKKKQIFNEQETLIAIKDLIKHLESIYDNSEERKYEQSFIKVVKEQKSVNSLRDKKREISTDDIFSDLADLKKRLTKPTDNNITTVHKNTHTTQFADQSQSKVFLWEEPETWKPKPFGIL